MPTVGFVSDLHLFARRSHAERHVPSLHAAMRDLDHLILGGDIFDFRWAAHSHAHVIDSAVSWLRELARTHAGCRVHFLLGNHDDHRGLIEQLPGLVEELPNFEWRRFYLRMGGAIFLHGDAADGRHSAARLALRRERLQHRTPARWRHGAYHFVIRSRLDRLVARAVFPRRRVVRRLVHYLRDIGHGPENGLREVFFGHTHRELDGFQHAGLRFHNGGAPIGAGRFRILQTEVSE